MSEIILKNHKMTIPIIQGGMGVGISLSSLAGTVAKYGGMGTISGVNPGYYFEDFHKDPIYYNDLALKENIKEAKRISQGNGIIAVNVMHAIKNFNHYVKKAVEYGADAIVVGAGLPLDLPEYVNENTIIGPIVSSKRALDLIIKKWKRSYNRLPDFIVVEGPLAGGHLGFKIEDLKKDSLEDILKEVIPFINEINNKEHTDIKVFSGGGIRTREDMLKILSLGAHGIQLGTPFIATKECDAKEGFKQQIINAKDQDLKIIKSPAGLYARAINNDFLKNIEKNPIRKRICHKCLSRCNPLETDYCLANFLSESAFGRDGIVFSGANIKDINKIKSVKEVIDDFMEEK